MGIYRNYNTPTTESQMEKKMENGMETRGIYLNYIGVTMGLYWDNGK